MDPQNLQVWGTRDAAFQRHGVEGMADSYTREVRGGHGEDPNWVFKVLVVVLLVYEEPLDPGFVCRNVQRVRDLCNNIRLVFEESSVLRCITDQREGNGIRDVGTNQKPLR